MADALTTTTNDEEEDEQKIKPNLLPQNPSTSSLLHYNHQSSKLDTLAIRYSLLFNSHNAETLSPIDSLAIHKTRKRLRESYVLNILWTEEEKEKFFTALARCGKGNVKEISRRVGTKSVVEVTAYIGILDEETEWRKQSSKKRMVYDLRKVPAAVEVDAEWLGFEDKMATKLAKKRNVATELDEKDSILNVEMANELAEWYLPSQPH